MSKLYNMKFGDKKIKKEELRSYLLPVFDIGANGKPIYITQQSHKNQCDVNLIVKKYDQDGLFTHQNQMEAQYGDVSGADFKTALDTVMGINAKFADMPSSIRKRFNNNPEEYLTFMENPDNRPEAIKIGLIPDYSLPESDGLGEHVKDREKPPDTIPKP